MEDIYELAAILCDLDPSSDEADIEDAFFDKFEMDLGTSSYLIKALAKLTVPAKSPLSDTWYQGFWVEDFWVYKVKYDA